MDGDFISFSKPNVEEGNNAPSSSARLGHSAAGASASAARYTTASKSDLAHAAAAPTTTTSNFRNITCDVLRRVGAPVHAMFHLTDPITLRGNCAVVGLCGQVTVQGHFLRQRSLLLRHPTSHVALQPLPRKCGKAVAAELAKWGPCSAAAAHINHLATGAPFPADDAGVAEDVEALAEIEATFGQINWAWTRRVLDSWRERFGRGSSAGGGDLAVVLVLSHGSSDVATVADGQEVERLPFFAPRMAPVPHSMLLETLLPELVARPPAGGGAAASPTTSSAPATTTTTATTPSPAATPTVMVVGAVSTGKSTTCRFVCNALVALYGECLWVDLDLGQSEFSPPGGMGLFRVTQPLFEPNQSHGVECVTFHYLGAPSLRDPVCAAAAIESICARVATFRAARSASASSGNAAAATQRQQQQRRRQRDGGINTTGGGVPVVINTHGWVMSTGRRTTVEALQRLRPNHIIHLIAPQGDDSKWLLPESGVVNDTRAGLSAEVFTPRFRAPGARALPALARGGGNSAGNIGRNLRPSLGEWTYTLHRFNLERVFEKDAAELRSRLWARYFYATRMAHSLTAALSFEASMFASASASSSESLRAAAKAAMETEVAAQGLVATVVVPLRRVGLVFAEDEGMPWFFRGRVTRVPCRSLVDNSRGGSNATRAGNSATTVVATITDDELRAELRDSVNGALVGVAVYATEDADDAAASGDDDDTVIVSQLCCEATPPNVCGFGIVAFGRGGDAPSLQFIGNEPTARLVEGVLACRGRQRLALVVGWQQFDASWNFKMGELGLASVTAH